MKRDVFFLLNGTRYNKHKKRKTPLNREDGFIKRAKQIVDGSNEIP